MKVGIIRCAATEDYCPGTADFRMLRERSGVFEGVEGDIELIGFTSCGGCPGKRVPLRVRELVKRGADTIVFASCIKKARQSAIPAPSQRGSRTSPPPKRARTSRSSTGRIKKAPEQGLRRFCAHFSIVRLSIPFASNSLKYASMRVLSSFTSSGSVCSRLMSRRASSSARIS